MCLSIYATYRDDMKWYIKKDKFGLWYIVTTTLIVYMLRSVDTLVKSRLASVADIYQTQFIHDAFRYMSNTDLVMSNSCSMQRFCT